MNMLRCIGLYKSYQGNKGVAEAVLNCNLDINSGECVVIDGVKGSGKSTLLRLLGGFDRPTAGEIYIKNHKVSELSEDELTIVRRREIGYLFQYDYLLPELTIRENIIMPTFLNHKKYDSEYYKELTRCFHLTEVLSCYPGQLDKKHIQCAAYVRALIHKPDIILLDEPADLIYQSLGRNILKYLIKQTHSQKKTLVMVTSDQEIRNFADHVIVLDKGVVIEDRKQCQTIRYIENDGA